MEALMVTILAGVLATLMMESVLYALVSERFRQPAWQHQEAR